MKLLPFSSFRRSDRGAIRKQERHRRFQVESLEGRQVLSTFTVTSVADSVEHPPLGDHAGQQHAAGE